MTKNSFHNTLLELIAKDKPFLEKLILFSPNRILKNQYFHNKYHEDYEIDLLIISNLGPSAIFEIKSHAGLRSTFTGKQYHRLYKHHPNSQIWLIYPNTPYHLDLTDLHCERFEKLGTGEIEYV